MIKSMTGYGRKTAVIDNMEITFEIKSVNNRYLDTNIKLPRLYSFLEDKIKKEISKEVSRAKVDAFLTVNVIEDNLTGVNLNKPLLEKYLKIAETLRDEYGLRDDMSVGSAMRLPDVITTLTEEEDTEVITNRVMSVVVPALQDYNNMRSIEGQKLYDDLMTKLDTIAGLRDRVKELSPVSVENYEKRLRERIEELLGGTNYDENRVVTEVAIYADKVAVDEELTRLESHISQFKSILKSDAPSGRKLDFLTQEINREVNTTGSKCAELEITKLVVEMKSEIEKIREQIQNIE